MADEAKTTFLPEEKNGVASALSKNPLDYLISLLPTNARIFVNSVLRGEKSPISEKDFTVSELDAIKNVILATRRSRWLNSDSTHEPNIQGKVGYADYHKLGEPAVGMGSILSSLGRVKTTLGQFGYKQLPSGDVSVGDEYDFSPAPNSWGFGWGGQEIIEAISSLGYRPLRHYAGQAIPEGEGRLVNITIPKEQFSDKEYATLFPNSD